MIFWLGNVIATCFTWLGLPLAEAIKWMKMRHQWVWACLVAYVFTPIGWLLDYFNNKLDGILAMLGTVRAQVSSFGFERIPDLLSGLSTPLSILNNFVDLPLLFKCITGLISLWAVCFFLRMMFKLAGKLF